VLESLFELYSQEMRQALQKTAAFLLHEQQNSQLLSSASSLDACNRSKARSEEGCGFLRYETVSLGDWFPTYHTNTLPLGGWRLQFPLTGRETLTQRLSVTSHKSWIRTSPSRSYAHGNGSCITSSCSVSIYFNHCLYDCLSTSNFMVSGVKTVPDNDFEAT
jgi:hypothetical protein